MTNNDRDSKIKQLVQRVQEGDQVAFGQLYDLYAPALYGLVYRIVQDQGVAEDVLQDSFVKIWKHAATYTPEKGSFFTWMLNISRNTSIDYLRKTKKERAYKIQIGGEDVSLHNQSEQAVSTIGIKELLTKLSPEQQVIIDYLYFKGYTQQETADELDLPLGTVKTRARSAVMELKGYFNLLVVLWIFRDI